MSARPSSTREAPSGRALVRFIDVEKSYDGESFVVQDLNLSIAGGEFMTLLGPSGSGKTTSLMMLAGFETPSSGIIEMDGTSIQRVPPYQRNIGVVFQSYALFPHMTVAENVMFPLKMRDMPRAEAEVATRDILDVVKMSSYGGRRPAQLSGGQQQRVALARALAFRPKLVLMDEPLGALDKQLREHMQLEIRRIHDRLGVTIVYVTHDQSEALTMSDRIAVFRNGRIQQLATPSDIYDRPASSFVARFIGENNLLDCRVERSLPEGMQVVLEDGTRIRAEPEAGPATILPKMVSVRPERVLIDPPPEVENRVTGRVEELIYFGDHARIRMTVAGNGDFMLRAPTEVLGSSIGPGSDLSIGWRLAHCRILSRDD